MQSGIYSYPGTRRVIYGMPFQEALHQEFQLAEARRVFLLASSTLERQTDVVAEIRACLGSRLAGVFTGMGAHTPRTDVVAAANGARDAGADMLLTVGGGSLTDAAKLISICLANDITAPDQLDAFRMPMTGGRDAAPAYRAPTVSSVIMPTTLSAGEFSAAAGCTDTVKKRKEAYYHPDAIPRTVILDPQLTVHTPAWLWLSTGMRAVDHAIEDLCSISSKPFSDGASMHALRLLGSGLRAVKADPANLDARLDCQLGAWMSMIGSGAGVQKGASHGIGHVLGGTAGVPHGYTSCVMMPHVLRFNHPVRAERQRWISEALGQPDRPAADVVADLIAELGLPQTLRDVQVPSDMLDLIAENAMHDHMVLTNPRPIDGPGTVRQLLDQAW
jgi:maleylacetate reductase